MLQSKKHWQVGADHDLACPRAEGGSELGLTRIGDGNANAYNCATRDTPGRAATRRQRVGVLLSCHSLANRA